jgi:hypothetical protein
MEKPQNIPDTEAFGRIKSAISKRPPASAGRLANPRRKSAWVMHHQAGGDHVEGHIRKAALNYTDPKVNLRASV